MRMGTLVQFKRREVLGAAGFFLALQPFLGAKQTRAALPSFSPDVEIELYARRDRVRIFPDAHTPVWRYFGRLLKGPENTLSYVNDSYLGPTLRLVRGQKVRVHLHNELPEPTITHWHGLHVPMTADGRPSQAIGNGQTYVYDFEVRNRASMNFYHPHTHEATATQLYRGLAGLIIVEDEEERSLELPSGAYEILLALQDRVFNKDRQFVYGADMHQSMFGFYGDQILVNGRSQYHLDVDSRAYRFRIVNASNARIYKLAWSDGTPLTVIGVDAGLLNQPENRSYIMLAPSERVDLWVDFSGRSIGSKLSMQSLSFAGLVPEMAQTIVQDDERKKSESFTIFSVSVARRVSESPRLPARLSNIKPLDTAKAANPNQPIPIAIGMGHMRLTLNGRVYEQERVLPYERIRLNSLQFIDIFHDRSGMGMMSMGHPIHLHGQAFQILKRSFSGDDAAYATIKDGFINSGYKDTVLVAPDERVEIIKPFDDFPGQFMYHCHNVEHEDMGMMREFNVE
jgi:FtsP/CotA-like multicopper oxidase with cupredoxin domain